MQRHFLLSARDIPAGDRFLGYVFQDERLVHSALAAADIPRLFASYEENCGVFAAVLQQGADLTIFSDPLSQYPLFYYIDQDDFVIGTDFFAVGERVGIREIDENVLPDYISYFSPLRQETLFPGVRRLGPYETIEIRDRKARLVARPRQKATGSYQAALSHAVARFRMRARAILSLGTPVLQLSGGTDSRMSLAALMSQGYRGPVFCFGGTASPDRQISAGLARRFGLSEGPLTCFENTPRTMGNLIRGLKEFQSMKLISLSNYGSGSDFSHIEVTGYYSESLIKGFGRLWEGGRFSYFDYARKTTCFAQEVFDRARARIEDEAEAVLERCNGHEGLANCLFYTANRSASWLGAHSAVNNRHMFSIDLIYDPLLYDLLELCPYKTTEILAGAIALDLSQALHSVELATFPYDRRVLPRHPADWVATAPSPSCFEPVTLPQLTLDPLPIRLHRADPAPAEDRRLITVELPELARQLARYPILQPQREGTRGSEAETLPALLCLLEMLAPLS